MAYTSNIEILECFQLKTLCITVDGTWYMPSTVIRRDLQIPTVKEEIRHYNSKYSACLSAHPNDLTVNFMELPDDCEDTCQMFAYQILSVILVFVILAFKA
jgi:hypothetical protein